MVALVPKGAAQHLARTPDLPLEPNDPGHTVQCWEQRCKMIPDDYQALEGVRGHIRLTFRKRITNPLLIPPFCAPNVLEDAVDIPAFVWIGLGESL